MADLLTIPELCDLLRITKSTAYTWVSRRKIPHLKLGRSVRFRRADALKLFREVPALRPLREVEYHVSRENGGKK